MAKAKKPEPIVSRESLAAMLNAASPERRAVIIGRALVVLLNRQTNSEQQSNTTNDSNNQGFASCDAKGGSLTAKSFQRNGTLLDWQLAKWMRPTNGYPRICRYARQLNEEAVAKAQRLQGLHEQAQRELSI